MLLISSFVLIGESVICDAMTGQELPSDYAGYCMVYFDDGSQSIFETGINSAGERFWWAIGNNPAMEYQFV